MPATIQQHVALPAAAKKLYNMYLSPRAHGAFTGAPVVIGRKPGDAFSAFGGQISGTMVATVAGRMIVHRWRSVNFAKKDADSTLILTFTPISDHSARIDLVHLDVSDNDIEGVTRGWPMFYWKPWREYLKRAARAG